MARTCGLQKTLLGTSYHLIVSCGRLAVPGLKPGTHSGIKVNPKSYVPQVFLLDAVSYPSGSLQWHAICILSIWLSVPSSLCLSPASIGLLQKFRTACTSFSKWPWIFLHVFSSRRILESVCKFFEKSHWEFDYDFTEFMDSFVGEWASLRCQIFPTGYMNIFSIYLGFLLCPLVKFLSCFSCRTFRFLVCF